MGLLTFGLNVTLLFHGLSSRRQLELLSTQRFTSGVQALHFRRNA